VADAVEFLSSDRPAGITGQEIVVDGAGRFFSPVPSEISAKRAELIQGNRSRTPWSNPFVNLVFSSKVLKDCRPALEELMF